MNIINPYRYGGIPRNGLIAEYLFDTNANDTSGSGTTHNGTLNGDAAVSSGVLTLDGTGDYVTVADSTDFEFTDGAGTDEAFSISLWFKSTVAVSAQNLVTKGDYTLGEYQFQTLGGGNSGKLALTIYNSTSPSVNSIYAIGNTAYTINTWHHAVVTYDGSETSAGIELYLDGSNDTITQAGAGTYTGMGPTARDLAIGGRWFAGSYGVLFTGDMDNVRIYKNKELTLSEVTALFNEGHS